MPKLKEMKPKQLRGLVKKQNKKLEVNFKRIKSILSKNNKLTTKLNGANNTVANQIDYITTANANLDKKDSQISILRKETLSLEDKIKFLENENAQLKQSGNRIAKENGALEINVITVESVSKMSQDELHEKNIIIEFLKNELNLRSK